MLSGAMNRMQRESTERNVKYRSAWIGFCAIFALLALVPGARAQNEVSLLVPNPFRGALNKLVPGFESKTGYKLKVSYGRGMGTREQIARGDMFDVSILLPPYPEALASGNIDPKSATTLASLVLALGVRSGAPKPDISTPAALKKALLAAKTVAYVDPTIGSDGHATREMLEKLGVADLIASKTKLAATSRAVANLVIAGDAEACIFYRNEMTEPGIDVVGRLPKQFANPEKVVAFISTHASDAKAAKALVDYLSSPEAEASYQKDGLERAR
jgi:molybdate transport system substrate-binding protein